MSAAPAARDLDPVSLVICSRGRPALLSDAIRSILAGSTLPDEIVIVDQSEVPLPDLPHSPKCEIRYYHQPGRGLSRARNEAIRLSRHAVLVVTDDDVVVAPDWLAKLRETLGHDERTVVTGRIRAGEMPGEPGFVPTLKGGDAPAVYETPCRLDPLVTFNMACYREPLIKVGGFDEQLGPGTAYPGGEDNELAFRLLRAGSRIRYTPDAVVYHRAWRRKDEFVALRWGYGRGQGAFYAKHLSRRNPDILRRVVGTIISLALRVPRRLWGRSEEPGRRLAPSTLALGDAALLGGLLVGGVAWTWTHRPGRDPAPRLS